MSTHFDGVNGSRVLASADPLVSLGTVTDSDQAVAMLWRPNEVSQSGLIKVGSGSAAVNPYSDGRVYYATGAGGFIHGGSGGGAGTPGEFYTATDGFRFDMFTCRPNPSVPTQIIVRRHTFMYNTGAWTHVDLGGVTLNNLTFNDPIRIGSLNDTEAGDQLIVAEAIWGTGGSSLTDSQIETMLDGLYAWDALNPTVLLDLENAGTKTIDPRGDSTAATSVVGASYSSEEPFGWTYSLTAPTPPTGVSNPLKIRRGGSLVSSTLSGFVRYAGELVAFGTVEAPAEGESLWGTIVPATQFTDGGDDFGITVGTVFIPAVDGTITHLKAIGWNGNVTSEAKGGLWQLNSQTVGVLLGTTASFNSSPAGTIPPGKYGMVPFSTPIPVVAGVPYLVGVWQEDGRYWASPAGYLNSARWNWPFEIPGTDDVVSFPVGGDEGTRNGRFLLNNAFGMPTDTAGGGCYFADVVFVADEPNRVRTSWTPGSTSSGDFSFGVDFSTDGSVKISGIWWYQPSGTITDVAVRLRNTSTQAILASGSLLSEDVSVGWNFVPFSTKPYLASSSVGYTAEIYVSGIAGNDGSSPYPIVDPSGHVTITGGRFKFGGGNGWSDTIWAGQHGIDVGFYPI